LCCLAPEPPDVLYAYVGEWRDAETASAAKPRPMELLLADAVKWTRAAYFVFVIGNAGSGRCSENLTDALGSDYTLASVTGVSATQVGAPLDGVTGFVFGASKRSEHAAETLSQTFHALLRNGPGHVSHFAMALRTTAAAGLDRVPGQSGVDSASRVGDQAKYWAAAKSVVAAAKVAGLWKDSRHKFATEDERASVYIRVAGGSPRAQALGDLYQAVGATEPGVAAVVDLSKLPDCKRLLPVGILPPLSKSSLPWSSQHMRFVHPADIGMMKGMLDVSELAELSESDALAVMCAPPSAVLLALATAAVCVATGHVASG